MVNLNLTGAGGGMVPVTPNRYHGTTWRRAASNVALAWLARTLCFRAARLLKSSLLLRLSKRDGVFTQERAAKRANQDLGFPSFLHTR
jgi:hypothetical protein